MLNQIIGYYFLGHIGKVKYMRNWNTITKLGFYFPRFDVLYIMPVERLIPTAKLPIFLEWLKHSIEYYHKGFVKDNPNSALYNNI